MNEAPPPGWALVKDVMQDFSEKMAAAVKRPSATRRKHESLWEIKSLSYQRTRYIHEMHYTLKLIDRSVFKYCARLNLIDAALSQKWRKTGYEKLCCLECADRTRTDFGKVCICRLPNAPAELQCHFCGCDGCTSNRHHNKEA